MNRLLQPTIVAALAAGGIAASTGVVYANVEIGGTAGLHVFSKTNELGVNDVPDANSEHNSALFGLRLGWFFTPMFGVEGEFGVIPSESRQSVFDVWNITYRAQVVAQLRAAKPEVKLVPFGLIGIGALQIVDNSGAENDPQIAKDTDAMLYLGAGAKYRVDNAWGLRADLRLLFPPSSEDEGFTQDFEALLSVYKEFGRPKVKKAAPAPVDNDPDKDGIEGDADQCPTEAEDKDGFKDGDGCPDPDNDADSIPDAADKCPGVDGSKSTSTSEDKDGFEDEDGCLDKDNDRDGVRDVNDDGTPPDPKDECPGVDGSKGTAEDMDGFRDGDGCLDKDNDGDGVFDAKDDGTPDPADKCPTEPETKNGFEDEDGCPDEIPVKLKQFTGVIQGINFKLGEATLLANSNTTLDKAVAVLKEFPDLKLEIQGHTDDEDKFKKGSKFANNKALSQARAEAVKAYFVGKGIDEARLTATGYGDTLPVLDPKDLKGAKLKQARAKNRRVEFKLVSALTQSPAPAPAPAPAPSPTP